MSRIKAIGFTWRRAKPTFVVVGWAVSLSSIALTGIVQGLIVPHVHFSSDRSLIEVLGDALYYGGMFGVSTIAGMFLGEIGKGLFGFLASYFTAIVLTYVMLILPGLTGIIPEIGAENLAVQFTFTAFFPIAIFVGLIGGILGAALKDM